MLIHFAYYNTSLLLPHEATTLLSAFCADESYAATHRLVRSPSLRAAALSSRFCHHNAMSDPQQGHGLHLTERMPTRKLHHCPWLYVLRAATSRRTLDPAPLRGHWGLAASAKGVNRQPEADFRNHKIKHLAGYL